jgi:hypothetical protein
MKEKTYTIEEADAIMEEFINQQAIILRKELRKRQNITKKEELCLK